jgi:hypothetical protein
MIVLGQKWANPIKVYTDLLVDLTFCLAYLVEMKQEADIHAEPPWMFKWRSYDLWFLCICLSLWNLFSFVMRMVLTGRPFSVFISFRSLIEIATTYPFLFSLFIQNGQYLYGNYLFIIILWYQLTDSFCFLFSSLLFEKLGAVIKN